MFNVTRVGLGDLAFTNLLSVGDRGSKKLKWSKHIKQNSNVSGVNGSVYNMYATSVPHGDLC